MNFYKLIYDEKQLEFFIDKVLPDNEGYFYISLLARKKWSETELPTPSNKAQLKKLTAKKEFIIDKLRQLEAKYGAYKIDGLDVPQEILGVYITPNPRDTKKATFNLLQTLLKKVETDQFDFNLHHEALSALQVSGTREYFDIDIDFKDRNLINDAILKKILQIINKEALTVVRTKGGYHVLVKLNMLEKSKKKLWYNEVLKLITSEIEITMNGDNMIPLVGCCQGGFVPYLVELNDFH